MSEERFYICSKHNRKLSATKSQYCPDCEDDFRNRKNAKEMTPIERLAAFDAIPKVLTMPFTNVHRWIDELVGRATFTHELGAHNVENIRTEILGGNHPTITQQLSHMPDGVQVLPIVLDDQDTQAD